jgi:hypothetical protein
MRKTFGIATGAEQPLFHGAASVDELVPSFGRIA